MPACPVCRDEFEDHVERCPTDDEVLVPVDQLPPAPVPQAQLGLFHPATVLLVQRFLAVKQVPVRTIEVDDQRVELWVPGDARDDVRAELTLNWSGFLQALEPDAQAEVAQLDDHHPGWYDAPQGAWIDHDGRLRVDPSPDEEAAADASRTIGPALVVAGVIVLLLAWFTGFSAGAVLLGGGAIVFGLLLPR